MELRSTLPKPIKNARRKNRERNLTWRKSREEQLQDTFRALTGVYFIHTIYCFEAREFRSPMLQTVCKSELERRSYGHWKTTTPSWNHIFNLQNQSSTYKMDNSTCEIFASDVSTWKIHLFNPRYLWPTLLDLFFIYFV